MLSAKETKTLEIPPLKTLHEFALKKDPAPDFLLAQDQEIQQLMARFEAAEPNGVAVQQVEVLVRTAIYTQRGHNLSI